MIDLHSHVLPGIDDGPATLEGSLALARAAVARGTSTLVATPHIDHSFGIAPRTVAPAVRALRSELSRAQIPLDVLAGGEIAISRLAELSDDDLRVVCLGEGPYLLVESPHVPTAGTIEPALFDLQIRGFGVLLAHPERSPVFLRDRERLRTLVQQGALCSITAGSLAGKFGRTVRAYALELLQDGLVHDVASDAHDDTRRVPGLAEGLAAAEGDLPGLEAQADWLTRGAPAAILSGDDLPPRPELPERRRTWRDRLRRAS
jgi:protein-tyrosine phosphatase